MPQHLVARRAGHVAPSRSTLALAVLVALALSGCGASATPDRPTDDLPAPSTVVDGLEVGIDNVSVVAAGDIARTPEDGKGTADLIRKLKPDAVLTLGDNAYDSGTLAEYQENYGPTWGAFKAITRPSTGNHDYKTPKAAGYFAYFREQVRGQPYYAWNVGKWRMYSLSCEVDCGPGSEQVDWLAKDLAANADRPALAYMHEPLYTCSTRHPPVRRLAGIWKVLQDANGQILLSSHNHSYERFAPQDAEGQAATDGVRQFVVGTGGASQYTLASPCANREAQDDKTSGVLELELRDDSYSWKFIGVGGEVLDSGDASVG